MKTEILKLDSTELNSLEKSKAEQIKATFEPMAQMLESFEDSFKEIIKESESGITKEITSKAKRLRIDIGKVRVETGKLKDKQKEYIKLEDKAIMGVHNILVWAVKEKEDRLKEIENYFEEQERLRLENLQKIRSERLSQYVEDAYMRDLSKFEDDEFEALYEMKKREFEDRIKAEKEAERIRLEEQEKAEAERLRMIAENERLRKEAEEKEAERLKELAKLEEERKAVEEEARKKLEIERAKAEAERKAREEQERKERAEYEAKLKAEREENERIKRELEAKAEAERKAREEEKARVEAELSKGDSAKINDLINDLEILKTKYSFKSEKNKKKYADVSELLTKIINHINN